MFEKILQKNEEVINFFYLFNKILILFLSSYISFKIKIEENQFREYFIITLIIVLIQIFLEILFFKNNRFYNKKISSILKKDLYQFFISILSLLFIAAAFKVTSSYSRIWIGLLIFFNIFLLFFHKYLFNLAYDNLINSNLLTKNILLIGNFEDCKKLIKNFSNDNKFHFRICIFVNEKITSKLFPIQQINFDKNLKSNIDYYKVSQVWIVSPENFNRKLIMDKLLTIPIDIRTVHLNDTYKDLYIENINGFDIYETSLSPFYGFNYLSKLLIDYIFGMIFLIISLPIILFFGLLIFIEDGRPIFFKQNRHGWDGNIIKIYKLRSLKSSNNSTQVTKNDYRLLKIGKFIRRFSIDELPQMLNILKGEMSIVGPRPHSVNHNDEFSKKIKGFMQRHRCKPGLTGLAQVSGYRGIVTSKEELIKRYEFDIKYIKKWSLFLDIKIILKTLLIFLFQNAH